MTSGARLRSGAVRPSITNREERLGRRITELFAHDQQFRAAQPLDEISAAIQQPGMRLAQIVQTVMEGYADRRALGQRASLLTTNRGTEGTSERLLARFDTITYRELWYRIGALASAWHHGPPALCAGDFVCFIGFNGIDYTTLDLACLYLGVVSVPLQTSAPVAQLVPIIGEAQPRIVAVSIEFLDRAVESVLAGFAPQRLVVIDHDPEDDAQNDRFDSARRRLANAGSPAIVESLHTVLDRGKTMAPAPMFVSDRYDDPLLTLYYTSGSSGTPKAAMYKESTFAVPWRMPLKVPAISLNYLPMSHAYGRAWLITTLASGGTAYFASKSDMSTLFEDLALVRPTALNLVPRMCDMIFERYQSELDRRASNEFEREMLGFNVMADLRHRIFGGRCLAACCGTAPLSATMTAFIEDLLDVPLIIGYGSTEAGTISVGGKVMRPPVVDYRLVDVPELGYFLTDVPHPRGELLVKTESLIPGYYKQPDATAAMLDEDGYYKTGDIVAEVGPDQLVYIDRRNHVLKLSQGEFVAVSQLEAVFVSSRCVRQIFIYGSSERAFVLAVVVPSLDAIPADTVEIKSFIRQSLQRIAEDAGLNSYEIPRDFLIESVPFSLENGLLTSVGKLARPALRAHYGERLEQLYVDIAKSQVIELRALQQGGGDRPVLETLSRAVQATVGCSFAEIRPNARFIELGGDSLSALAFSTLLQDIFEVDVPVGMVIASTSDLTSLTNYIEQQRKTKIRRPTFASVHGRNSSEVYASELTLDKFIDAKTLEVAKALPKPNGVVRTVLLTGANGYLGRFLLLEWLQRLEPTGGTVVAVVRGSSSTVARQRIEESLRGDPELTHRFCDLAEQHLEVIAGDIGEPNLGLDDATWDRLADDVDLIVHAAALVNHALPYSQLFGPNVLGTAELIRLAITKRLKAFNYVSSVAAAIENEHRALDENADVRTACPVRKIHSTYANGYANSKWAGEVLAREAHDLCGLPVVVFRSDMILAHSTYAGQLNVPDVFTRLLLSLVATGVAPRSFYRTDPHGNPPRAHYDGLPVDFTAEAIASLGVQPDGFVTYNVVNSHDDGISLDQLVEWLIDAGYPIQRIDNYDDWLARFETTLCALPALQRAHSVLPLLDAFKLPTQVLPGSGIQAERFRRGVQAANIGPDGDIPHLSSSLIVKYIADLKQLQLL